MIKKGKKRLAITLSEEAYYKFKDDCASCGLTCSQFIELLTLYGKKIVELYEAGLLK